MGSDLLKDQKVGGAPRRPADVVKRGHVVFVEPVSETSKGKAYPDGTYALRQVPDIDGGLVALDPHTGRVLAMSGRYSYERRRVQPRDSGLAAARLGFQADRLPGGPGDQQSDAGQHHSRRALRHRSGRRPRQVEALNYSDRFYGPTPMRIGIEKSRNLMTVRLAQTIGMENVVDYAQRLDVIQSMPPLLSMSLGSVETTLMRMTAAYAMLVNGGKRITPSLIDRIQDRAGKAVFRHDERVCPNCRVAAWDNGAVPRLPDEREQVADPRHVYQVVSMLQGVVDRGTGTRVKRSASRSAARPARPMTPSTLGSLASRRIWPSESSSASTSRARSVARRRAPAPHRRSSVIS